MKAVVLCNHSAGGFATAASRSVESLADIFRQLGVEAEIRQASGDRLTHEARQAAQLPVDVIVAAGGDGSVSAVAAGILGSSIPLGVLPLGTLNHFARDLNLPLDPAQAAAVIAAGATTAVDVGWVNDCTFINNSSLGMYPQLVLERDAVTRAHGTRKWIAMAVASLKILRRFPLLSLRLAVGDQMLNRRTPMLVVGNNRYALDLLTLGKRERLNEAVLGVYVARAQSRWGMLKLALRALVGRLEQSRDFEALALEKLWVESKHPQLRVALDGEVRHLQAPLEYRTLPKALTVLVPRLPTDGDVAD